ncbi:MAG: ABC transporter ATP-binding protein [Alphaproteobacteria bacterium]|nr:ABC transporter ATP-binding protein [Alphaproteobacteria bacterium]
MAQLPTNAADRHQSAVLAQPVSPAKGQWTMIVRLGRDYVRRHLTTLSFAVVAMLVTSASTPLLSYLVQPALDLIFTQKRADMLVLIPLAIVAVVIVRSISGFVEQALVNGLAERIVADTQRDMFRAQIHLDLTSLNAVHSGEVVSKFLYDAQLLRNSLARGVAGLGKELLTLIGLMIVMLVMDWQLTLISLVVLPAVAWVTQALGRSIRKSVDRGMQETSNFSTTLSEALAGRRIIKAYGLETYASAMADAQISQRLRFLLRTVRARAAAVPATDLFGGLVIAFTIFYAGWEGLHGHLTLGHFAAFLAAMLLAQQPVRNLTQLWTVAAEGLSAATRIFEVIDARPSIVDRSSAKALAIAHGGGAITFDQVRFSYHGDAAIPAVDDVSFSIAPGQKIALVGPSGAGKSTLFNLLLRFYDVDGGAIRIDGHDIRDLTLASLRAHIALVTQEPILFDATIAENIALGRQDASRDEIMAAANTAAAHDFIMAMSDGYETRVGEGGLKLSGGQRQRIAIARAMVRNAPILLLDEATSALDSESERQVQDALGELMRGRTTLVIAHRLSTVLDADCIFVLDHGRVAESGSHSELLARKGLYARLYQHGFEEERVSG